MLRYIFLPFIASIVFFRLLAIFIIVFVLNGCVPAAIGEMVQSRKFDDENPQVICANGVQGYLKVTAKVEVTGTDKKHLEVHCK